MDLLVCYFSGSRSDKYINKFLYILKRQLNRKVIHFWSIIIFKTFFVFYAYLFTLSSLKKVVNLYITRKIYLSK